MMFSSQAKAAEALGISATNISEQINGKRSDVHGYRFKRICLSA